MKGNCEICDAEIELIFCCPGKAENECGCGGQPIEPPVCDNKECGEQFYLKHEFIRLTSLRDNPNHFLSIEQVNRYNELKKMGL